MQPLVAYWIWREGKPRSLRAKQLTVSCRAGHGRVLLRQHDDNMLPFQCHSYRTVRGVLYVFISSLNNPFTNEKIKA